MLVVQIIFTKKYSKLNYKIYLIKLEKYFDKKLN